MLYYEVKVKVTWHVAKNSVPYSEFVLFTHPSAHTHCEHIHSSVCVHTNHIKFNSEAIYLFIQFHKKKKKNPK